MAKRIAPTERYPKCVSKYAENEHERDSGNPTGVDKSVSPPYCESAILSS